jgi:hypothetical protein
MNKTEIIRALKETSDNLSKILYVEPFADDERVSLNVKMLDGRPGFFVYSKEKGKQEYLCSADSEKIKYLAHRYYDKRLRAAALREKKQIDRCIVYLEKEGADIDCVYDSLPDAIKKLVSPDELTDDGYAERWQKEKIYMPKRPVGTEYVSLKGDRVRSKSEVIIADRLFHAGVPYKYEWPYSLDGGITTIHPDFVALNKRTREEILWEHCGKMDDSKYCAGMQQRLEDYSRYGYFPGKRLILTYESSVKPLNTEYVDKLIKEFLL